ncbi:type III secretion system gatekeeper subunit SctW [Pseudomonas sp.]|uniref:type III secretion system gatekeeper subunit SctW n=1 Tax=Pseudomonas sp. TaxID=306 RepID=UPI00260910E7|nr:type III secretion system gatekeeper subunit SctW [Pseudomonas sp.]
MKIVAPSVSQVMNLLPVAAAKAPSAAATMAAAPTVTPSTQTPAQQVARFATALGQQSRTLSDRNVMVSINTLQSRSTKLGELFHQLMGSHDKGLDEAARNLRKALTNKRPSLEQVFGLVEGDAAKAHVMLQAAARQAQNEGATGEHVMLSQQLKILRRQYGGQAKAGINTARAFARSGISVKRRQALRNLYYEGVVGQQSISALIEALLGQHDSEQQFEPTLHDIRSAIADDLASLKPSTSPQQLRSLMHGLSTARHVATLVSSSEHLLGRMRAKNPQLKLSAPTFLKHVLALSSKGMSLHETLQLAQQVSGNQLKHQLAFLNGLRPMLQQLPILLWRDPKARQNALGNMLILMAELTRQEQGQSRNGGTPA